MLFCVVDRDTGVRVATCHSRSTAKDIAKVLSVAQPNSTYVVNKVKNKDAITNSLRDAEDIIRDLTRYSDIRQLEANAPRINAAIGLLYEALNYLEPERVSLEPFDNSHVEPEPQAPEPAPIIEPEPPVIVGEVVDEAPAPVRRGRPPNPDKERIARLVERDQEFLNETIILPGSPGNYYGTCQYLVWFSDDAQRFTFCPFTGVPVYLPPYVRLPADKARKAHEAFVLAVTERKTVKADQRKNHPMWFVPDEIDSRWNGPRVRDVFRDPFKHGHFAWHPWYEEPVLDYSDAHRLFEPGAPDELCNPWHDESPFNRLNPLSPLYDRDTVPPEYLNEPYFTERTERLHAAYEALWIYHRGTEGLLT